MYHVSDPILRLVFPVAVFVRYGEGADGSDSAASATEVMTKYSQFQDVHVMIFIGFGMLMLFLKKYAYSSFTYSKRCRIMTFQLLFYHRSLRSII